MRNLLLFIFNFFFLLSFSQNDGITVPANTQVKMEIVQELREGKNKVGEAAQFRVTEDVVVDGVVVIPAKSLVRATVTNSKNRELRVDITEVQAVDGSYITLADCWIFTTAAQNYNGRGALIVTGTKKNCFTSTKTQIKKASDKF